MTSPRRKLPPLNALRAFEAAARHLSFKDAADELSVTATAVSHQIRHLESLVGTRLFDRMPRSIALTPAGLRLYPVLRDSFDRMTAGVNELSATSHHLRISATPAFASRVIVPALPQFHAAHPAIQLAIDTTERVVDLRRGDADMAVRYGRGDHAPLEAWPLADDAYIAVAAPGVVPDGAPADALSRGRLLHYAWKNEHLGGPTWGRWMAAAGVAGFNEARCQSFSDEALVVQAALDGVGVALLSDLLVRRDLALGRLVQVHPLRLPGLRFAAVAVPDHPQRETIGTVVHWLRALVARQEATSGPSVLPVASE